MTFATEIGVVDLDPADHTLAGIALEHDLLQLVLDLPGGGLRHPEATAQLDAGDALLGLGQVIDRTKSQPQRRPDHRLAPRDGRPLTRP
jgi:hypothetical protein